MLVWIKQKVDTEGTAVNIISFLDNSFRFPSSVGGLVYEAFRNRMHCTKRGSLGHPLLTVHHQSPRYFDLKELYQEISC